MIKMRGYMLKAVVMMFVMTAFICIFRADVYAVTRYSTDVKVKNELISQIDGRQNDDQATLSIYLTKKKFNAYYANKSKFKALLQKAAIANDVMYVDGTVTYYKGKYRIEAEVTLEDISVVTSDKAFYKAAITILKNRDFDRYIYYQGNEDNAYTLMAAVYRQFPEYGTAMLSYGTKTVEGTKATFFSLRSGYSKSKLKTYYTKAQTKAKSIIGLIITDSMTSDADKVKAIHDYLANNCTYSSSTDKVNYTAYGCLVNGEATCQGYAAAFNLLLHMCDIKCIAVTGTVQTSSGKTQNHAWNYAYVDGTYLYYDVTWDDDDTNSKVLTTYYGVDRKTMEKDHTFDTAYDKYLEKGISYSSYTF